VNANVSEAAKLVEKFDIVKAAVAEKAIPYCNITYLEGAEMKDAMEGYLGVLFEQNPKSVGGVLPEDDFYYTR
jgi:NitT/TauT family transport system substrate-binding protein